MSWMGRHIVCDFHIQLVTKLLALIMYLARTGRLLLTLIYGFHVGTLTNNHCLPNDRLLTCPTATAQSLLRHG